MKNMTQYFYLSTNPWKGSAHRSYRNLYCIRFTTINIFQSDIAKVLNTTQSQYSLYETGMRLIPIDKLEKLAKYYDTSIDYLIGLTNERKPYPRIKK